MSDPKATEQGQSAVMYFNEQLWEAHRGVVDAYKIDTQDTAMRSFPAWKDLTKDQQALFTMAVTELSSATRRVMDAVAPE